MVLESGLGQAEQLTSAISYRIQFYFARLQSVVRRFHPVIHLPRASLADAQSFSPRTFLPDLSIIMQNGFSDDQ